MSGYQRHLDRVCADVVVTRAEEERRKRARQDVLEEYGVATPQELLGFMRGQAGALMDRQKNTMRRLHLQARASGKTAAMKDAMAEQEAKLVALKADSDETRRQLKMKHLSPGMSQIGADHINAAEPHHEDIKRIMDGLNDGSIAKVAMKK